MKSITDTLNEIFAAFTLREAGKEAKRLAG
jgi:hypothetical protein